MGKPTGFLEFARETAAERNPLERVKDWDEFHLHLADETLRTQGSRCLPTMLNGPLHCAIGREAREIEGINVQDVKHRRGELNLSGQGLSRLGMIEKDGRIAQIVV